MNRIKHLTLACLELFIVLSLFVTACAGVQPSTFTPTPPNDKGKYGPDGQTLYYEGGTCGPSVLNFKILKASLPALPPGFNYAYPKINIKVLTPDGKLTAINPIDMQSEPDAFTKSIDINGDKYNGNDYLTTGLQGINYSIQIDVLQPSGVKSETKILETGQVKFQFCETQYGPHDKIAYYNGTTCGPTTLNFKVLKAALPALLPGYNYAYPIIQVKALAPDGQLKQIPPWIMNTEPAAYTKSIDLNGNEFPGAGYVQITYSIEIAVIDPGGVKVETKVLETGKITIQYCDIPTTPTLTSQPSATPSMTPTPTKAPPIVIPPTRTRKPRPTPCPIDPRSGNPVCP